MQSRNEFLFVPGDLLLHKSGLEFVQDGLMGIAAASYPEFRIETIDTIEKEAAIPKAGNGCRAVVSGRSLVAAWKRDYYQSLFACKVIELGIPFFGASALTLEVGPQPDIGFARSSAAGHPGVTKSVDQKVEFVETLHPAETNLLEPGILPHLSERSNFFLKALFLRKTSSTSMADSWP